MFVLASKHDEDLKRLDVSQSHVQVARLARLAARLPVRDGRALPAGRGLCLRPQLRPLQRGFADGARKEKEEEVEAGLAAGARGDEERTHRRPGFSIANVGIEMKSYKL